MYCLRITAFERTIFSQPIEARVIQIRDHFWLHKVTEVRVAVIYHDKFHLCRLIVRKLNMNALSGDDALDQRSWAKLCMRGTWFSRCSVWPWCSQLTSLTHSSICLYILG